MRSWSTLVVLGVLLLAGLVPLAAGDHVYTHRYVVSGRLVDGDGDPVANETVTITVGPRTSEVHWCRSYPDEMRIATLDLADANRTNAHGDFEVCLHVHDIVQETPLSVTAGNLERQLTMDDDVRLSFIRLADDEADGEPPTNRTLLVRARAWEPWSNPIVLDGIRATGRAKGDVDVNVTVTLDDGRTVHRDLVTDRYGDVAAYLPVDAGLGGNVTFSGGFDTVTASFTPEDPRANVVLLLPRHRIGGTSPLHPEAVEETPRFPVPAVASFVALAFAAPLLSRTRRS